MAGGGVSFGDTAATLGRSGDGNVQGGGAAAALALLLRTCLGVPGHTSHLNGTDPGRRHESSIAAAIAALRSFSPCPNPLANTTSSDQWINDQWLQFIVPLWALFQAMIQE